MRRVVSFAAFVTGLVALVVAAWVFIAGRVDLTSLNIPFRSHDPWRPVLIAIVSLVAFVAAGGRQASALTSVERLDERWVAGALAIAICVIGITCATTVAGGADSYGYVSEADLWLKGHVKQPQPWAQQAPWPSARWSFAPLGYRPGLTDPDAWSLVPVYSPGLPLLMAGAKLVGGQEAMFWIVPMLGGLLVVGAFGIGRRLGAPKAGLIGAFLVATSPAVLFMLVSPMTDVAVAGAWTVAFYFLLGESRASAFAAGLASAVAILIRPNLAFEGLVLGLWYLLRFWGSTDKRRDFVRACLFAAGVAPGFAAVAAINTYFYGSPLMSGYGSLSESFDHTRIATNAGRYLGWFDYAHTPWALVGFVPLMLPLKVFWPNVRDRRVFLIIGAFVSLLLLEFLAYLVFDAWWYLRFILPCLPFIMIGLGAAAAAVARRSRWLAAAVAVSVGVLAVRDGRVAVNESAFDLWRGDLRYVAVAKLTRRLTDPSSVIYAMQHSGSLRYYGGRLTVRYDEIDNDWLDRSLAWFESRGVHPYLLVEEWELEPLRTHFAGSRALAMLDTPPLMTYEGGARIFLFDLAQSRNPAVTTLTVVETFDDRMRSTKPAAPPAAPWGSLK
ncbi:MAG TPA: hypothetical protein VLT86_16535 [Vicinamibacterales bacterium]|nr:hypothetical protein [Vicinamibacterales bacterium]